MLDMKTDKRLNYVPLTETAVVSTDYPYSIKLKEIPDVAGTITIANMVKVNSMPINSNEFYISRTGDVYFQQAKKGTSVTISYMGGGSRLSASDWNAMVTAITNTNTLINGLTSLVFGNIKLIVTPTQVATPAAQMNTAVNNSFKLNFTCTLATLSGQPYTWLQNMPLYVAMRYSFLNSSNINAPVIANLSTLQFVQGVCQFTSAYDTDFGAYKKYTAGDYVSYTMSTVDPTTNVGINLTTVVTHTIQ